MAGGVYGFGVTFPDKFVVDDQDHRPKDPPAGCVRQGDPGWNAPLVRAPRALLGACADTPIPAAQFCSQ